MSITSVHFIFLSGERGIWTLAPVLPTYSLSRGAPSASWVFLQKDTYQCGIFICKTRRSVLSGEDGIRTHVPVRTNGFQDRLVMTASIPLRIAILVLHFSRANKWYVNKKVRVCQCFFRIFFVIFVFLLSIIYARYYVLSPFFFPFFFPFPFSLPFCPEKLPAAWIRRIWRMRLRPPLLQPVCKLRRAEKALIRHEITAGRKNPVCDGPDPCPPQAGLSSPKPQSAAVCFFFITNRQSYNSISLIILPVL